MKVYEENRCFEGDKTSFILKYIIISTIYDHVPKEAIILRLKYNVDENMFWNVWGIENIQMIQLL